MSILSLPGTQKTIGTSSSPPDNFQQLAPKISREEKKCPIIVGDEKSGTLVRVDIDKGQGVVKHCHLGKSFSTERLRKLLSGSHPVCRIVYSSSSNTTTISHSQVPLEDHPPKSTGATPSSTQTSPAQAINLTSSINGQPCMVTISSMDLRSK